MKHKLLTGSLSFTVGMGFSALPAVAQQSPASTEVKPNVIIINVDDLGSVFNVSVNNRPWLNHFSPAIEVGGNRCISKKLHVAVTGGNLTVNFEAVKGMTFLNGIKIFRIH